MKIINTNIWLTIVCFLFFVPITIAQQIWTKNSEASFVMDNEVLTNRLKEITVQNPQISLSFPNLDGEIVPFKIYDNAVLSPSLASKYPQIHSYKGISIEDSSVQLRFTCTPSGIEGTLISSLRMLNLTSPASNKVYILQEHKTNRGQRVPFECNTKTIPQVQNKKKQETARSKKSINGLTQLRTIRLAVTTSGEYSDFFVQKNNLQSASDAQKRGAVLAGVSTSINAINVAFERDLGVRFQLISNTDQLFFLDSNTDPFPNPNNADRVIDEGAEAIKSRIATADYDLGHTLVGAGSGGLASVGTPCTDFKAEAMTGFREPEGFFFDFTLFAHELGHQLGGLHTQSANCQIESPVEVGSGTTIMGYSGACGNNDVQPQSDAFFHSLSVEQIFSILENLPFISDCGIEVSPIANNLPAIPEINNYTVPLGLPIYLETTATDIDIEDVLTYSWEPFQINNGFDFFPSPPRANSNMGPQFRVFPPTRNSRRDFPKSGVDSMWEVLPTVARTMDFKLFVRDGNPGGIAVSDIVQVTIVNQATQFGITNPNAEIIYDQNEEVTINWDVAGTNQAPFNVNEVKIEFSYDNGVSYPEILAEKVPNNGSATVIMPAGGVTSEGKIRISALENAFYTVTPNDVVLNNFFPIKENVKVFPNPSNGGAVTFLSEVFPPKGYDLKIYSITGQLLIDESIENENQEFNFDVLIPGIYLIRIALDGESDTRKLVIE